VLLGNAYNVVKIVKMQKYCSWKVDENALLGFYKSMEFGIFPST